MLFHKLTRGLSYSSRAKGLLLMAEMFCKLPKGATLNFLPLDFYSLIKVFIYLNKKLLVNNLLCFYFR